MGRIGYDDLLTLKIATRTVIVVDGHQTRQFSMGARIGLEGEVSQSREGTERLFQEGHQCLGSRDRMGGLRRMEVLELRQGCHLLVDLRIVLHRTGAERIEARIDTEVIIREVRVVAHHREFVALW